MLELAFEFDYKFYASAYYVFFCVPFLGSVSAPTPPERQAFHRRGSLFTGAARLPPPLPALRARAAECGQTALSGWFPSGQ
jgi:hypothetical protein